MNRGNETWIKNLRQKLEDLCTDIDEHVCKEPVLFVGNQMGTVGTNMRNFFSGFVDDFGFTKAVDSVHVAQLVPSNGINLVENSTNAVVEIEKNTVDSNTNSTKEAPWVPKELCHKPSSSGLHPSEQITFEISQDLNKISDNTTQNNLNSSANSQNFDNRFEEGVLVDESLHSDATACEYSDWGIENITDLNLDIKNMIEGEPLMNLEEKKTHLNIPVDELECDSNTSTTHHSSDLNIGERGSLLNHTSDNSNNTAQDSLNSSANSQNFYNGFDEGVPFDESLISDVACEYSDWGIENIIDLKLDIDSVIEGPLMDLEEKKTLLNRPNDELECDSNTSTTHQSSELESSVTCNEKQEEDSKHIIAGGLSSEKIYESLNSSFRNSTLEPNTIDCNPTETVDYLSGSSDIVSSCGSFTTLSCDSNSEADVSCCRTEFVDGSTADFEDIKCDMVESGVIFQGGKISLFPNTSRSKSYKKMIQDAFMSKKRLTKEYKQLAIWYGDVDKELCQPTESIKKPAAQYQPDSEWELL